MFSFSSWFGSKPAAANENGRKAPFAATQTPAPETSPTQSLPATHNETVAVQQQQQQQQLQLERPEYPPVFSARSLRQLGLFFGGASFLYLSMLITRRAVARHQAAARLKFYQPNHLLGHTQRDPPRRGDPKLAFEALHLATLNTASFAVMMTGGLSWAFDISSVDDLRRIARRSIEAAAGGAAGGDTDLDAEKEVAEWVAKTLGLELPPKQEGPENGDGKR